MAVRTYSPHGKLRKSPAKGAGQAAASPSQTAQAGAQQQPQRSHRHPSDGSCHRAKDATQHAPEVSSAPQAHAADPYGRSAHGCNDAAATGGGAETATQEHSSGRHSLHSAQAGGAKVKGHEASGDDTTRSQANVVGAPGGTCSTKAADVAGPEGQPGASQQGSKDSQAPKQDMKPHLDILTWLPLKPTASRGQDVQADESGAINVHFNVVHRPSFVPDGGILCA